MSTLLSALAAWKPFSALVVGDLMLDRLTFGDVDRLANDAPVPVLAVSHIEQRAGGAANVALDLVAMRASVTAVGVVGDDADGVALRQALTGSGVSDAAVVSDPGRPTTVKQSLIGLAQHRHAQKMFRLDFESRRPLDPSVEDRLLAAFAKALPAADVVCLEDYAKGVCTPRVCQEVIRLAAAAGKPVLVDPAAIADYSRYAGAAAITPNRDEAVRAAGQPASQAPEHYGPLAQRLIDDLGLQAAVITLDKHGALLLERDGEARVVPTVARHVYDVTGAGDMVLAALAAARAQGLDWYDAVRFANAAAGLEVEQFGVVPIPLDHIHRDLLRRDSATRGKLHTLAQLQVEIAAIRQSARGDKKPRVVFTNGVFDVLHAGHAALLRQAKDLGDYLVVAINTDAKVRQYKGPNRPVNNESQRAFVLSQLESVDAVIVFDQDTPIELIDALRPDVLAKGGEYEEAQIPGAALVQSYGGSVHRLPMLPGLSTTGVLRATNDPRADTTSDQAHRARFIDDQPPKRT